MTAKELERRVRQSEQDKAKSQAGAFCKYESTFLATVPQDDPSATLIPDGFRAFITSLDIQAEPWETKCVETRMMSFRVTSGPGTFATLSVAVGFPVDAARLDAPSCAAFREVALTEGTQTVSLKVPVVAQDKFNLCLSFKRLSGSEQTQFFLESHVQCRVILK